MKKKGGGGGGCLGAPMRALSRACDSACDLYVRGMSGCARGVPRGSSAGIVGRGFGGTGAATLRLRVSSDKTDDDLVRAAAASSRRQRRVAAEPETATTAEAGKVGSAGGGLVVVGSAAAAAVRAPARKRAAAATMGTIAEDAPCEFGLDGACAAPVPVPSLNPPRRGGFVAVKPGADVFAR